MLKLVLEEMIEFGVEDHLMKNCQNEGLENVSSFLHSHLILEKTSPVIVSLAQL